MCTGNELGDECDFTCSSDKQLNGAPKLTCISDGDDTDGTGAWDNTAPTCDGKVYSIKIILFNFVFVILNFRFVNYFSFGIFMIVSSKQSFSL